MARKSFWTITVAALMLGAIAAAFAQAVTFKSNDKVDFDGLAVFVPCANGGAGEVVVFQGNLHVLITATINGNNVRFKEHFQPQGLQGVGLSTGDKYNATGVTQDMEGFGTVGAEITFVNNFRMIGQGPGNNILVHENFPVTVNANGDITANHDNATTECK